MISVKDAMPESQRECLLYDTAGYWRTGYWHAGLGHWCGMYVPQYAVITHWCYLPERPR